jgi:hypothetical protein
MQFTQSTYATPQRRAADFGGSVLSSQLESDGSVSADLVLPVPSPELPTPSREILRQVVIEDEGVSPVGLVYDPGLPAQPLKLTGRGPRHHGPRG